MFDRMRAWSQRNMPTRDTFENSRWLRPIAHRVLEPSLWRFHRRSVARGVALGVLVGVLIPIAQTVFAALLALPARANVPVAALTTFITNPFTTPPIWLGAYWIGSRILGAEGAQVTPGGHEAEIGWVEWTLTQAGPATLLGLVIIAVVGAAVGYLIASFGWRGWVAHKWAERSRARALRP
ncbi:DUF2062 domain-containing protein [Sphingomonas naphthae]|uniref:DUF2062 domain-containing protein n=1 Tax=Sphingomonas naphthae TaxID=1813468 RepID=A0ABY7TNS4_9SPHN|nr:DUF2062 domain-containing protein [Sphingomonas naphthae]WCT74885.1 DUF2062 domain-containing protein [Sphingomonas naphthae]